MLVDVSKKSTINILGRKNYSKCLCFSCDKKGLFNLESSFIRVRLNGGNEGAMNPNYIKGCKHENARRTFQD